MGLNIGLYIHLVKGLKETSVEYLRRGQGKPNLVQAVRVAEYLNEEFSRKEGDR